MKKGSKIKKPHPTDGLKGLCLYFDGEFSNPQLSKIMPYVFAFGGRVFSTVDDRVKCVVKGKSPSLKKKDLAKFPDIKVIDYEEFLEMFTLGGYI